MRLGNGRKKEKKKIMRKDQKSIYTYTLRKAKERGSRMFYGIVRRFNGFRFFSLSLFCSFPPKR